VIFKLKNDFKDTDFIANLEKNKIKVVSFGPQTVRMVTHLDFKSEMLSEVEKVLNGF